MNAAGKLLQALGERLRLARKNNDMTAQEVADLCGITRVTLRRVEAGEPTVSMGTYANVLAALGLADGLNQLAKTDAPTDKSAQTIRIVEYPLLREVAWHMTPNAEVTAEEAFSLYERNWRHIDQEDMTAKEQKLLSKLTQVVGKGVLLV